jgi:hypothetical protein
MTDALLWLAAYLALVVQLLHWITTPRPAPEKR